MLQPVQQSFPSLNYANVLVGLDQPDDAAVIRLNDEQALVQTVDFFSPVVDDPYYYGAIAAANAISDIYAMGGTPLFALNILALPEDLPAEIVREIMRGGADKAAEAGCPIVGGHTVKDKEPKYGLCVTGLIHPSQVMKKGGAQPGDVLVLTKPLGVGVITTAMKRDQCYPAHFQPAIESMSRLNKIAAQVATQFGARGGTDITGFGLLGHAIEMATQAKVQFVFDWAALPWLPGALAYGEAWVFPGGAGNNQAAAEGKVTFADHLADWQRMLLHDPETSGGLLLPIAADKADAMIAAMQAQGQAAWRVGHVQAGSGIVVR